MNYRWGKNGNSGTFLFLGSKITEDGDCSHKIKICLLLWKKAMTNLDSILKSRDIPLLTEVCRVKAMVFPVVMYRYQSWTIKKAEALKNWCFQTVVLGKTLKNPWDCKEINPVNPKGNQPWIFIGRTDAETKPPMLWPPDEKSWLIGKLWYWERLREGEEENQEWDGWIASPN